MLFIDRSDGTRVRNLRAFNAVIPYAVRRRSEAGVLFSKDIDVEAAMAYVRRKNAELGLTQEAQQDGVPGVERYSLFGILVSAAVRSIALKPRLNRFVHRRGFYQRRGIYVSFIVKKSLTESSAEGHAKIRFEPDDDMDAAMSRIAEGIERARSGAPGPDDKEFDIVHSLPFGKAMASGSFRFLDRLNVAPRRMIENDPLFTSLYVANLGSIGLDTPYHPLYDWGTASAFMVVGRVFQRPDPKARGALRHYVNVKFTVDERIAEGIYFAHAAALFQRLVSRPESLEERPDLSAVEA
jgi:hypothetical protein